MSVGRWALVVLVGLVVIGLLSESEDDEKSGGGGGSGPDNGDEIGAQVVCEDQVRSQLKAPDTAEFEDVKAKRTRGSKFVVRGAVDSENSFGAKLRAFWICDAEHIRGDRYRVNASLIE